MLYVMMHPLYPHHQVSGERNRRGQATVLRSSWKKRAAPLSRDSHAFRPAPDRLTPIAHQIVGSVPIPVQGRSLHGGSGQFRHVGLCDCSVDIPRLSGSDEESRGCRPRAEYQKVGVGVQHTLVVSEFDFAHCCHRTLHIVYNVTRLIGGNFGCLQLHCRICGQVTKCRE